MPWPKGRVPGPRFGKPGWNKGKHWPLATKRRIGLGNRGKVLSEETREKISAAAMGRVPWNRGKTHTIKTRQKLREAALRQHQAAPLNSYERLVKQILDLFKIEHRAHERIGDYVVDFYIPSLRLVVEVDGHYWHKEKRAGDLLRDDRIRRLGYELVRIRDDA